ncbi:MAG: polysaccharide pyruvyl transferase family protein [Flavonifractor plautii]
MRRLRPGNAGDDAILEAIVTELRQIDPDLPIWVLSRNPDDTRLTYRVNSIYTFAFPASCGGCAKPTSTSTAAAP